VVTSDYGAGVGGGLNCQPSPGGQRGLLQVVGPEAALDCRAPLGAPYASYDFASQKGNLPDGQDLATTFKCMASVGTAGCLYQHSLESVYAALKNTNENGAFVRSDALLAVLFLTAGDDASAPPVTQMFDDQQAAMYGYPDPFRKTRFGVTCGDPPALVAYGDSGGPLSHCIAAPNLGSDEKNEGQGPGLQYDLSRYIDLFTKPASAGGIKDDPANVVLAAIDAPTDPLQVILSDPATPPGKPYSTCAMLDEGNVPACVPVLQHSCQNPQTPTLFGDPPVRLNTVVTAVANHAVSSICDSDYTGALMNLANLIVSNIGGGCIPSALPDPNNPDCVVEDVTRNADGTTTTTEIPQCASPPTTYPCWHLEHKDACAHSSPDGVGITIERNGQPAPDNTDASVACATIAG
jgi:hypothetical protein